jgi:NlpC/P60 family putative phage cell wall peptidase
VTPFQATIVAEARAWLGTPYVHQASLRGAGTDCLGLVRGVWRAVSGHEPERPPAYTPDWGEAAGQELLLAAALRWMVPSAADAPGDVLLLRMREGAVAKHLGIATQVGRSPRFVHAYTGHGVVESAFSAPWARRLAGRFAFPERMG